MKHLAFLWLLFAASFSALAVEDSREIPLQGGADLFPESISFNERTRTFYISANGDGSVQTVKNGRAEILMKAGADGRTSGLGIKVDARYNRLWVVSAESVYLYQLSNYTLLAKIDLASAAKVEKPGLNDLVIDDRGDAFVTDSFNALLFKIDGGSLTLSVFRDLSKVIPYGKQNDFAYNLNGILLSPEGTSLIAVKTNDGTLWRINLLDTKINEIKLSEAVTKGDGLVWGQSDTLYVMRNFENKISAIDLSKGKDEEARAVRTVSPAGLVVPTSAVFLSNPAPYLYIVNSQFGKDKPTVPFFLSVLPVAP